MFENIDKTMKILGLEHLGKRVEINKYLVKEVDPYIKSLIKYLIKNRPNDVRNGI